MEIKDLLDIIGFEGEAEPEKVKEHISANFITRKEAHKDPEVIKKIEGSRTGAIMTKTKQLWKDFAEFKDDEKIEDILEKVNGKFVSEVEKLKETGKQGNDKKVNDLTAQLEDKDKSLKDYKVELDTLTQKYTTEKEGFEKNVREFKKNHFLKDLMTQVPFVDDMTNVQRMGYNTLLNSKYIFDLEEDDKLIVKDKDGHPVKSKDKPAGFAEPLEVLINLAKEEKLFKNNNVKPKTFGVVEPQSNGIKLHPKAVAAAQ